MDLAALRTSASSLRCVRGGSPGTRETPVVPKKQTPAADTKKSESKKAKKAEPAAVPPKADAGPRRYFSQLTPEEQSNRKQIGYLSMCWATIGSVILDQFVVFPHVWPTFPIFFLTPIFIVPLAVWFVMKVYWK